MPTPLTAQPALASSGDSTHFAINAPIGFLALAALLAWLLLFQLALWRTRPAYIAPGQESLDFGGAEPPAVTNLLVSGWRLGPDAATATLVDLAARRILGFEQQGPDARNTVVRVRQPDPEGLTTYERAIFNRVSSLARGGVVPAAALVRGDESWAKSWWRRFRKAVVAEARQRGLSRDRWGGGTISLLRTSALVPVVVSCVALLAAPLTGDDNKDGDRFGLAAAAFVLGWALLVALVEKCRAERDTPAGREAAARWLGYRDHLARDETFPDLPPAAVAIWDRHLAYAAAFGIARTTVRVLPLGARSDRVAWSAYGGEWHQVTIRYPGHSWGFSPWNAGLRGLVQAGIGIVALKFLLGERGDFAHRLETVKAGAGRFDWTLAVPIAIAALILARGAVNLFRALAEYPSRRETVGEVVRLVRRQVGDSDSTSYIYYGAVDDGRHPRVRALRITAEQYVQLDEGDVVRVVAGPHLGRIFGLEVREKNTRPGAGSEWDGPEEPDQDPNAIGRYARRAAELADRPARAVEALVTGQNTSGAAIPAPTDLLRPAEVGAALGVPVDAQEAGSAAGVPFLNVRMCTYRPRRSGYPKIMVQVTAGGMARRLAGSARRLGRPVPGVPGGYQGGTDRRPAVVVLRGDLSVKVLALDRGADPALVTHLAQLAASRLPGQYEPGQYQAGQYGNGTGGSGTPPYSGQPGQHPPAQ